MTMHNIGTIISSLVVFQLAFVALYLISNKKGNKRNNRILAGIFLMFAINMLDFALRIGGFMFSFSLVHLLDDGFFFLYGPAVFFYTQGVVFKDLTFSRRDYWHLVPFLLISAYLISILWRVEPGQQQNLAQNLVTGGLPIWVTLISMSMYLHVLGYLLMSWRLVRRYQSIVKDQFSDIDEINLDWLSFMIKTFSGITVIGMINSFIPLFDSPIFFYTSVVILLLMSFYFINLVLVKALNQPAIFSGIEKQPSLKYASSSLDQAAIDSYKQQLLDLMHGERLFLKLDLKSVDLADKMGISTRELSQLISQGFQQNFYDFVNTFRCEEVIRLLQGKDKKLTITEAMYRSGFNSKSSFNKEFKKLTGRTPKEFKKG